jgi:hypothetical protein
MIVWEILTGARPFDSQGIGAVVNRVLIKARRPPLPGAEHPSRTSGVFTREQWRALASLIPGGGDPGDEGGPAGGCWAQEPSARLSFADVVGNLRANAGLFGSGGNSFVSNSSSGGGSGCGGGCGGRGGPLSAGPAMASPSQENEPAFDEYTGQPLNAAARQVLQSRR